METSLYQGEAPAISRAPQGQTATTHPMQQLWDQNAARATQNAYALEDTIVDYIEDTRTQQLKTEQNQIEQDLRNDLTQALSLANGVPGSPFKKDGLPNEAAIRSLINKHQSRIRNWESGYLSLQGAQTAALAQQQFRTSIGNTVKSAITSALKPRALSAFKNNYNYAIAQGRTQDAIASVDDLYNKGYIDEAEAALYKLDAQEKGLNYKIKNIASFTEADNLIRNQDFMNACTPAQQKQIRSMRDYYASIATPAAAVLKPGAKGGSTNPQDYQRTAPLPPAGVPWYMEDIFEEADGDFSSSNPNARTVATQHVFRWAMDTIPVDNPTDPEWEAVFRSQTKAFGIDESAVTAAIKAARTALSGNVVPNFKKAIAAIPDHALGVMPNAIWTQGWIDLNNSEKNIDSFLKPNAQKAYEQALRQEVGDEEANLFMTSGLTPKEYMKARAAYTRSLIEQKFTTWYSSGNNSKATYETMEAKLNQFVIESTSMRGGFISKKAMEPFLNIERQAKLARDVYRQKIDKQQGETAAVTAARHLASRIENKTAEVSPLSYEPSASAALPYTDTAAVIYVPKGYTALGKAGQVKLVNPATGKINRVTLMETEGIDHPHLSSVLYQHCGIYKYDQPPVLDITRQHGKIFIIRNEFATPPSPEQQEEQGTTPTYGDISQNNQLLPEWAESQIIDDTAEEAVPVSHAYPTGPLPF